MQLKSDAAIVASETAAHATLSANVWIPERANKWTKAQRNKQKRLHSEHAMHLQAKRTKRLLNEVRAIPRRRKDETNGPVGSGTGAQKISGPVGENFCMRRSGP